MATTSVSKRDYPTNSSGHSLRQWLLPSLQSTVGMKFLVALTGLALTGFVFGHMAGNLLIFKGRDALNAYAAFLKSQGPLLWVARIGLLAVFVIHLGLALRLRYRNQTARPNPYVFESTVQASWASRHMALTGIVILLFVLFHLMHFTLGAAAATTPEGQNFLTLEQPYFNPLKPSISGSPTNDVRHDVYTMVVLGFRSVPVSLVYIAAMICLMLHLSHGIASVFQSLGWSNARIWPTLRSIGLALAVIVAAGNIAMPVAVMVGLTGRDVPGQPPIPLFSSGAAASR